MNNREVATLIWLAVGLALALRRSELRTLLLSLVKDAVGLLVPLVLFACWIGGLVVLAHAVGLWEADVRNDTVVWFLTVGVGLLFSLKKVTEPRFFRNAAGRAFALTVFVEAFMNLGVFSLPVELVLLPVITSLAVLALFTELANRVLAVIGACAFVYVLVRVATDFDAGHTFRALSLPVWLTIGSLPFVYAFGLVAEYEQAFRRIDFRTDDRVKRRRAKLALIQAAHFRVAELGGFAMHWISDLAGAESSVEARAIARRWRKAWRAEQHAQRMDDARAYMEQWLTQTDPAMQDIWADTVHRSWDRLDREQRATLKAEAADRASNGAVAGAIRSLPD